MNPNPNTLTNNFAAMQRGSVTSTTNEHEFVGV
jgi:hypothetical protein